MIICVIKILVIKTNHTECKTLVQRFMRWSKVDTGSIIKDLFASLFSLNNITLLGTCLMLMT